jgi:NTE family protein
VIEVLLREQVPIDLIIGTSMGGIIGAMLALGLDAQSMSERLGHLQGNNLFGLNPFSARARQRTIHDWLASELEGVTFDDLHTPLVVTAVDMVEGREVHLDHGPLIPALLATSAVPAVFPPIEWDGMQLADGGVIDSLCTHLAFERGAERVIAVDVYPALDQQNPWSDPISAIMGLQLPFGILAANDDKPPSMIASLWRSTRVMTWHLHQARLQAHTPDVLLCPSIEGYSTLDFKDIDGPRQAGILEAERHLDTIRALCRPAPPPEEAHTG